MLSIVSGQEAGKQDECDRKRFVLWYDTIRLNESQRVVVWTKESSSRYTPKLVRYVWSQRFLEANAIIIQTFFRLRRTGVPLEIRRSSIRFLYYIGRAGVILLDKLHFDPIIRHWVRPRRGYKGVLSKSTSESGFAQEPVPWMSHISRLCVTKLCASESCLDQPTEPSRTDPMQFTYFVLNLRRSPERLRDFCQVARAAGLSDIETIEAIDGQTLKVKDWQNSLALTDKAAKAWETKKRPNDLACMLSHLTLWKRINRDNKPGVHVIFEDDADIPEDFIAKLKACLPTLPEDFEYAYLGHNKLIGKILDLPGRLWLEPQNT